MFYFFIELTKIYTAFLDTQTKETTELCTCCVLLPKQSSFASTTVKLRHNSATALDCVELKDASIYAIYMQPSDA